MSQSTPVSRRITSSVNGRIIANRATAAMPHQREPSAPCGVRPLRADSSRYPLWAAPKAYATVAKLPQTR
jgi:hypothetical protein